MRNVLVADSASIMQFVIERILGKNGFTVHYAKYSRDFIELVRQILPDVIFLEAEISYGKGLRICHYLQRNVETAHIPIVLMTRISRGTTDFKSWPGVKSVLRKPLSADRVLEVVRHLELPEIEAGEEKGNKQSQAM